MSAVEAAGTSMAFPSTTAYLMRDEGIDGPEALAAAGASGKRASSDDARPHDQGPKVAGDENLVNDDEDT